MNIHLAILFIVRCAFLFSLTATLKQLSKGKEKLKIGLSTRNEIINFRIKEERHRRERQKKNDSIERLYVIQ